MHAWDQLLHPHWTEACQCKKPHEWKHLQADGFFWWIPVTTEWKAQTKKSSWQKSWCLWMKRRPESSTSMSQSFQALFHATFFSTAGTFPWNQAPLEELCTIQPQELGSEFSSWVIILPPGSGSALGVLLSKSPGTLDGKLEVLKKFLELFVEKT